MESLYDEISRPVIPKRPGIINEIVMKDIAEQFKNRQLQLLYLGVKELLFDI